MVAATKKKPAKKSKTGKDVKVVEGKHEKKAKAKKPKPETIKVDKLEWDHHLECQKLAGEIDKLQSEYNELKSAAKDLKEAMAGKSTILRRLLRVGPERMPLFDAPKPAATNGHASGTNAGTDADAWKGAKIIDVLHKEGSATFTKGIKVLIAAGIETVGQLEERRAASFNGNWFDGIDKLGREGADEIENATLDWLSQNRDAKELANAGDEKPEAAV